jgi:hypothetical protein
MDSLLHLTAVMLIVLWAIAFFALGAGIIIHMLLLMAVISIWLAIVQSRRKYD